MTRCAGILHESLSPASLVSRDPKRMMTVQRTTCLLKTTAGPGADSATAAEHSIIGYVGKQIQQLLSFANQLLSDHYAVCK
jgi:hypothetical protein